MDDATWGMGMALQMLDKISDVIMFEEPNAFEGESCNLKVRVVHLVQEIPVGLSLSQRPWDDLKWSNIEPRGGKKLRLFLEMCHLIQWQWENDRYIKQNCNNY